MTDATPQEKIHYIQSQELRMCSVRSILEYIQMAIDGNRAIFNLEKVTLVLLDNDYEIRRILENLEINLGHCSSLIFVASIQDLPVFNQPRISAYDPEQHARWFPGVTNLAWVAELPLRNQTKFYGTLNFGSTSREVFEKKLGVEFLHHLSAIAGVCLDNALAQERLKYAGLIDPLTETNNRRFFEQRLEEEVSRAKRANQPLACLFMDVDHFKRINDDYGHPLGDKALRHIAAVIRSQLRTSDVLARYGGEEFVALLPNTDRENALLVAERIRTTVATSPLPLPEAQTLPITVSLGLAISSAWHQQTNLAARMIEAADHALLAAKRSGRNRVILWDETENEMPENN